MGKTRHRSRKGSSRSGYSRRHGSAPPCCCPLGPFSLPATGIAITAIVFITYRLITETERSKLLVTLQAHGDASNITTPVEVQLSGQGAEVRPASVPVSLPNLVATASPSAAVPVSVPVLPLAAVATSLPPAQLALSKALATHSPLPIAPLTVVLATDVVPLETVEKNYTVPANDSLLAQKPVALAVPETGDENSVTTAPAEGSQQVRHADANANPAVTPYAAYEARPSQENSANFTTGAGAHGKDLGEYDTSATTRAGLPTGNANHSSVEVRKGNDILRIPRGSRITGALPVFSGVITPNGSMVRGQNVTRVSYALYKIVKLFGFTSMVDSPAGSHKEWMSPTLQRIEFDRPSFKYWGIDGNLTDLHAAREAIGAAASSEYRYTDVTDNPPAGVDVLFHWTDLDGSERDPRSKAYPDHIERVIRSAQRTNATYIIFGQFPRRRGYRPAYRYGKWVFLDGARAKPFLYNDYVRGVVPVMPNAKPYVLYMTFYSVKSLPF